MSRKRVIEGNRPPQGVVKKAQSFACVDQFHKLLYDTRVWMDTTWLGTRVQKIPFDLWVYQEIIYEKRPDVIIECGTAQGGSALFLACVCELVGCGRIVTIDVRDYNPFPDLKEGRITFIQGSSASYEVFDKVKEEIRENEKVMVILDSDHSKKHVENELALYADLVTEGQYLVVEDTNINGHPVCESFGEGPMEALEGFLKTRKDFAIDGSKEKYFVSFNPRGFLLKNG